MAFLLGALLRSGFYYCAIKNKINTSRQKLFKTARFPESTHVRLHFFQGDI